MLRQQYRHRLHANKGKVVVVCTGIKIRRSYVTVIITGPAADRKPA